MERPNLFTYLDYRQYLRDMHAYLKATVKRFSHRYFAKRAGIKSASFLGLVMAGKRNISHDMARQFAAGLQLSPAETRFFIELVAMNQAKDDARRAAHYEELARAPQYRATRPLERGQ